MKKVLIIVNVLLVAAVAYLFYLHYSYITEDQHKVETSKKAELNAFKVAYFELDSLQENYVYYKEIRDILTKKDQQNTEKLNKIKSNYLNKLKEYQQKGPSMTQNQQSEYQQALGKLQNDYSETEQSLGQEMQAESAEKLQAVKMAIQDFLKTYCAAKGFAFVFASNESDYLYYKDTVRDITPDVVKGLNEAYQKTKIK
ncbi:MAG TPA: OmpH family outer membrane protein [Panacibacter sp.]|nr:OmpH family outer membrane protein [Panacibacter sp.]